jgi:hypothetical protein
MSERYEGRRGMMETTENIAVYIIIRRILWKGINV